MALGGCFYLLDGAIVNEIQSIDQKAINGDGRNKVQRGEVASNTLIPQQNF